MLINILRPEKQKASEEWCNSKSRFQTSAHSFECYVHICKQIFVEYMLLSLLVFTTFC